MTRENRENRAKRSKDSKTLRRMARRDRMARRLFECGVDELAEKIFRQNDKTN